MIAVDDAGIDRDDLDEGSGRWPTRGEVCEFLHSSTEWNGIDDHWSAEVVVAALRDQFTSCIAGAASSTR